MNYPKMLYRGEAKYTESHELKEDLTNKVIKTSIVLNSKEESIKREEGYVDLSDLLFKPKEKLGLSKVHEKVNTNVGSNPS